MAQAYDVAAIEEKWQRHWRDEGTYEVSNDDPRLVLRNAELSTVILDAQGNVLGGGSGNAFASLPPAAREFFKIERGLDAVPMYKAASAMVSAVGTYDAP